MPVAVLVVCGAPLTRRVNDLAKAMLSAGWETHVVGTPSSAAWIDAQTSRALGVRFDFRSVERQQTIPPPDVVAVCPATFNTVNKIAAGVADNYATSFVCEAIGVGTPVLVTPMVNHKLWGHPQWENSLNVLRRVEVRFLDPQTGSTDIQSVTSGTGDVVVRDFKPSWLLAGLHAMLPCG